MSSGGSRSLRGATLVPAVRTLLVDDEPLARERIRALLAEDPEIELVEECVHGLAAVQAIRARHPELLYLDVQMPEMDGFSVLKEITGDNSDAVGILPVVVFVTAYDQYALRAFEVEAIDYLLKPFDRDRFFRSLRRAKTAVLARRGGALDASLEKLLQRLGEKQEYPKRVVVTSASRVQILKVEEIDWIESAGNYVRIRAGKEEHLLRETMKELEAKLDPELFLRIHRTTIVNLERIRELHPLFQGGYSVLLKDGTELAASRNYGQRLRQLFGKR